MRTIASALLLALSLAAQQQISRHGITWTIDPPRPAGTFCNGDPWVIGPATVTHIDPPCVVTPTRIRNGSTVDPPLSGAHGYDTALYGGFNPQLYEPARNVALRLPWTIQTGSLVSTIGKPVPPPSGPISPLQGASVLTVLDREPPQGAFRPAYSAVYKPIRAVEAQLDYRLLGSLQQAPGAPQGIAGRFERVWLDSYQSWLGVFLHPEDNMPAYYRDFTSLYGTGALLANCDIQDKRDLVVNLVQIGLDFYSNLESPMGDNGHRNGRKFPILFAGWLLRDRNMLAIGYTHPRIYKGPGDPRNITWFPEDGQTFHVEQTSPDVWNWGYGGYTKIHKGMAEWGNFHTEAIWTDDVRWGASPYRVCCSANGWVGQALVCHLMGLRLWWNHEPYFDYLDRYMKIEGEAYDSWQTAMWRRYR